MLLSLYIHNFRSILDLKLDFSYGEKKAPNGYQQHELLPFIEIGGKHRIVPCMAFFGANASGKTNILKSLDTLDSLVLSDRSLNELFEPHLLNPKFSDTTFILEFVSEEACFEFKLTYNGNRILEEAINKNGKPLYVINSLQADFSKDITTESYSKEKLADILRVECSDGEGQQTKSFLKQIGRNYLGLNADLRTVFAFFVRAFNLWTNTKFFLPDSVELLAFALKGDKKEALRRITDVVRRLDIDIDAINIVQRELSGDEEDYEGIARTDRKTGVRHAVSIHSIHKNCDGKETLLDFIKHESAGTQRIAGLIGYILYVLEMGGVLLVDELECSLHPLILREILVLFKSRRYNQNKAQLIFTTHSTDILDDAILRISEIALVKKTMANGTLVRRLVDIRNKGEDIRNITNFRNQYLQGLYSGIPHPAL